MFINILFLKFLKAIQSFINFLKEWEVEAEKRNFEFIATPNAYGLKITLQAALEITNYLIEKCSFQYVMTARLNQDNLEVMYF